MQVRVRVCMCISMLALQYNYVCVIVGCFSTFVFIVRCVGGSKAPPVLHSSYRTDFERDCAV